MKHHSLRGLKNRNLIPHSSGSYKSEIRVLAGLVCSEGPSPWLVDGHLPLVSSHGLCSVHVSVLISCISLKINLSFQTRVKRQENRIGYPQAKGCNKAVYASWPVCLTAFNVDLLSS